MLSKPLRALIVEDSEDDSLLLIRQLRKDGFEPDFERVDTVAAMNAALEKPWDIVFSDFSMPQFSGMRALQAVQQKGLDIPFIIVSGKIGEDTAVAAMRAGAHDYIMKDNLKRLGAAVERELLEAENRRQRRQAEQALRDSEANLAEAQRIAHLGSFEMDVKTGIVHWSDELYKIYGLEPGNYTPDFKKTLQKIHPDDREHMRKITEESIRTGLRQDFEYRIIRPDGTERIVHNRGIVITGQNGAVEKIIGTVLDVTEFKKIEEEAIALSNRLISVQEEERRSVARELHDETGQYLTVVKLLLEKAKKSPPDQCTQILADASVQVTHVLQQVRNLSLNLRPGMLDDLGLIPALIWLFERLEKQSSLKVEFHQNNVKGDLAPEINTAAYRIIQEALTNILRYAGVNQACVKLDSNDDTLFISVQDNGCGFDPGALAAGISTGLSAMRERSRLLGGNFHLESSPGHGTQIIAELPLRKQKATFK